MDNPTTTYDQATRRASNDGRRQIFGSTHRVIAFVCECGAQSCYETVRLTTGEYDHLRPAPVLAPGHDVGA